MTPTDDVCQLCPCPRILYWLRCSRLPEEFSVFLEKPNQARTSRLETPCQYPTGCILSVGWTVRSGGFLPRRSAI